MAVLSAALHKAVVGVWDANLDWEFKKYWSEDDRDEFLALNDGEASPAQPMPYCIFEILEGSTFARMSGHDKTERHEIHDLPLQFRIYARTHDAGGDTAKDIAAYLAEQITIWYGGHPTRKPKTMAIDQGSIVRVQYDTDFGVRQGEEEHMWQVNYLLEADVPMAV